ncbi:uncharacterized protein LOC103514297 isoform X2 [Diaphorina citri]|uniref:Uncharacterized protein LOC103514297 isoform X2 n=1 Tax=Diaphorina citri TaxID=121845 RepID=A0A3Q0J3Q6_DIACI|nr:uncharacterized protein LOC103514297 isoform X2 [Diaphorina citri]
MYKLHTCSDRTGSIMLPKDVSISPMYIPYVQAAHLFRPDWFYYVTQRYLHSFQGRPRVSLRSLHAAHIHRRRAPVRYDANARHVGRASGRAVRSGDADYTADIADAATLDPIPEGVAKIGGGGSQRSGDQRRNRGILSGGDSEARGAGRAAM